MTLAEMAMSNYKEQKQRRKQKERNRKARVVMRGVQRKRVGLKRKHMVDASFLKSAAAIRYAESRYYWRVDLVDGSKLLVLQAFNVLGDGPRYELVDEVPEEEDEYDEEPNTCGEEQ